MFIEIDRQQQVGGTIPLGQHMKESRLDIILDEIEDLNLDHDGPISTMLRKGAKQRLSMLLASQEYSTEKGITFSG